MQKKREREGAIFKNSKLTPEQRTKWLSIAKKEYMSSEESGEDDCMVVHPLPWRSEYVNKMFNKIDLFVTNKKSSQAKRQMRQRKFGAISERGQPGDAPDWAVRVR